MTGIAAVLGGIMLMAVISSGEAAMAQSSDQIGASALARLDLLPRFKPSVKVGSISSYDRTGGNDDGFSGKYSFIRKEGDGLVIADLQGPGAIYRIWTPTPTNDPVEFYFDGETTPRIRVKFIELFDGTQKPFISPLSGFGSGGFYTYVPLTYKKSCKVIVRAPRVQFYQINYAVYPADVPIETYKDADDLLATDDVKHASAIIGSSGQFVLNITAPQPNQADNQVTLKLVPGKTSTVFQRKQGGRILGMMFSPASAFSGKDRAILLRVTWDGDKEAAILCPASDFFGYSWGDPAARSLLIGTSGDTAYCYFTMPFEKSAKIELIDTRVAGSPSIEVTASIFTSSRPKQADEGRFYAVWHREKPTTIGKPFTYVETQGKGHLVGVTLQAQGNESGNTYFFEGDDQCYIDGELAAHGTGSEDFFNGGWYDVPGRWEQRASYPLSGCLDYKKALGRTGGYRLFISDAYAFNKELKLHMEHSGEGNSIVTDYVGVSYLYMEKRPTTPISEPLIDRKVVDFDRFVYVPGWNVPLHAFSFQNATLAKKDERIGDKPTRYLSMQATGNDVFGLHYVSFIVEIPVAGRYRVSLEAVEGPGQATVQVYRNEHGIGTAVDLYSAERRRGSLRSLGTLDMSSGDNQVMLKLIGKNAASSGLGLDLVQLVFEREK